MKKALILVSIKDTQLEYLRAKYPTVEFTTDPSDYLDAEIILGWKISQADQLLKSRKLKWVQSKSAGVDYFPLEEFAKRKIKLTTASGLHSRYIAETVAAYLLIENRGLRPVIKNPGVWDEPEVYETSEQTALIFGTGNIGKEIARYCHFFEMKTIGVNRHGADAGLADDFDKVITMDDFESAKEKYNADYVINILPGTKYTNGFFNKDRLEKINPGYSFINVGRGTSVVTSDLTQMLSADYVKSAYLDVFEEEPLKKDSPLWYSPKIVATPHISGLMAHFKDTFVPLFDDNLEKYLADKPLHNLVDLDAGY
ncbi:NAD(P)-dependent oxidoreductase [Liquorilactobacillus mali]|uniref:NAD(P)-dependent oxidoreductase n=1 Tax=Liquorilactobacillus mali TaxID=1618 RepID=UPI00264C7DC5|nr:NAD(P)-dependent oxidoreductase [Liquorilactobacillus mali]MDN7145056.1 NAD(P)-dependent oxidoreductase [Liquorilactobacillus mali]